MSAGKMTASTEVQPAVKENTTLKYILFFTTFATAVANMFMGGRVKSYMNMRIPFINSAFHAASSSGAARAESAAAAAEYDAFIKECIRRNQEWARARRQGMDAYSQVKHSRTATQAGLPDWIARDPQMRRHLQVLKAWPVSLPYTELVPQLKENYHRLAKEFHPDLADKNSSAERKQANQKIFQEITASYRAVMDALKTHDSRGQY